MGNSSQGLARSVEGWGQAGTLEGSDLMVREVVAHSA
jgi:hypothetical protein